MNDSNLGRIKLNTLKYTFILSLVLVTCSPSQLFWALEHVLIRDLKSHCFQFTLKNVQAYLVFTTHLQIQKKELLSRTNRSASKNNINNLFLLNNTQPLAILHIVLLHDSMSVYFLLYFYRKSYIVLSGICNIHYLSPYTLLTLLPVQFLLQ